MFNQKSTFNFNDWWKSMRSFRAWNAFSRISSQPESRGMPWSHFVAWLYVLSGSMISTSLLIRSFCKQSVPNVTKHLYIFEGLRSLSTQSHRLSSELAGVCDHLALSNSMVAKCKALHAKIWHRRSSKLGSCPRLAMPLCGNQRILLAQPGMGIWGANNRQAQFWQLLYICNDWNCGNRNLCNQLPCFRSPALHDQAWGTIVVHL